jgi:hypothetical protein
LRLDFSALDLLGAPVSGSCNKFSSTRPKFGVGDVVGQDMFDGAEGAPELDRSGLLLIGGGTPVVVEVKSQSVTDPGRRGSRTRLERVARDVLERSSDQTAKAAAYIVAGGRSCGGR